MICMTIVEKSSQEDTVIATIENNAIVKRQTFNAAPLSSKKKEGKKIR